MLSFELSEELTRGLSAAMAYVFQSLANPFSSVCARGNIQQALIGPGILNHRSRPAIHCQNQRAFRPFQSLH